MADEQDPKQSREEFAEARRALVDRIVADHPGLTHQDFNDVKISEFDTHAKTVAEQRTAADREAGARALGISLDEFDALKAKPAEPESTPQSRAANLPAGRPSTPPPTTPSAGESASGAWGLDLIAEQASEDIAVWTSTGKWPRKVGTD